MRRFIAGAKCPQCGETDKLFVEPTGSGQRRQCVSCDFQDALENLAPAPVPTRVQPARPVEAPAETVQLVDPRRPAKT